MCGKNSSADRKVTEMKTYLRVLETVESAGVRAWLVGDPVREIVMGVQPVSLSIVTEPCSLEELAAFLGRGTVEGATGFPTLRASIYGAKTEITCMRGASIEEELARRDFSINAIALRSDDSFVDPWGGRHDIRNGLVRITGDDIDLVRNDPIRIVRMLRFAAELNMNIFWKSETDVFAFIEKYPDRIRNTPPERWGREILNGMRRRPYDFICLCDRYRLLPFFFDDLEQLKEIRIDSGDTLFDHTLDTLRIAQEFLAGRKRRINDVAFSLATLFHHVGSEVSQPVDMTRASDIATRYLRSWNMNSDIVDTVSTVVRHYRLPYTPLTEEQICHAALKYGFEAMEMIVSFAICNSKADRMRNMEILLANRRRLGDVLRRFDETRRRTEGSSRYLSGDEVMGILRLQPGKAVGEILGELDMAVGTGLVSSRREATDWVNRRASAK